MIDYIKRNKFHIILGIFILLYAIYFSYYSVLRHQTIYSDYYDLGIMDQTVYNTFQGRFLEMTSKTELFQIKRMEIHNDILLAFLAPFYLIYSGPETLLVLQSILIALGAIPLYLLAKKILKSEYAALGIAFCYLMYPPLQRANQFDFHAVTLATPLLLFFFYFAYAKKYIIALPFLFLALFSKEEVGLTTAFFGLWNLGILVKGDERPWNFMNYFKIKEILKDKKNVIFSIVVFIVSITWFALSFWVIIPAFRQGAEVSHFALERYGDFGNSPEGVMKGILTNPLKTLNYVFRDDAKEYLFFLLSPVAFMSLFAFPIMAIAAPEFAINMLSGDSNMINIFFHYTSVITPFIFISAIFGLRLLHKRFSIPMGGLVTIMLVTTLVSSAIKGPLPYSREKQIHPFAYPSKEISDVNTWSEKLNNDKIIVSTTAKIAPHFTNRRVYYLFSERYTASDYVIVRLNEVYNSPEKDYNTKVYNQLIADQNFVLVDKKENFEVYRNLKSKF